MQYLAEKHSRETFNARSATHTLKFNRDWGPLLCHILQCVLEHVRGAVHMNFETPKIAATQRVVLSATGLRMDMKHHPRISGWRRMNPWPRIGMGFGRLFSGNKACAERTTSD